MKDYIDILIESIQEQTSFLGSDYYIQQAREYQAHDALIASLDSAQQHLYEIFEENRFKTDCIYENALLRQAFLLAREVYR